MTSKKKTTRATTKSKRTRLPRYPKPPETTCRTLAEIRAAVVRACDAKLARTIGRAWTDSDRAWAASMLADDDSPEIAYRRDARALQARLRRMLGEVQQLMTRDPRGAPSSGPLVWIATALDQGLRSDWYADDSPIARPGRVRKRAWDRVDYLLAEFATNRHGLWPAERKPTAHDLAHLALSIGAYWPQAGARVKELTVQGVIDGTAETIRHRMRVHQE